MITYAAINLTNKRFYVGSTTDIVNRQRSHLNSKAEYPFQNSLRKDPENFYWIVSEEDELETRNEEQYYLNFYYGTKWCYNLNPDASCPPSSLGRKLSEEQKAKISAANSGRSRPDLSEMNKTRNMFGENNPMYGATRLDTAERNRQRAGKHWYTNPDRTQETLSKEAPENWVPGRKKL
jgi:group I intron endonuclease